jgi:hypothetical protein
VRSGRAIANLLLMVALLAPPSSAQFRADTILSVLRINDVVFASTRTGLFQSTVSQQKWTPMKLPKGVLPGGCLNSSDAGVTKIYYSPPATVLTDRNDRCAVGFGLWMSADSGKTWKKIDATHWFKSVLARKDGALYASARVPADKSTDRSHVVAELEIYGGLALVSTDGGKTWLDISGTEPIPPVTFFATCSKNPAYVCAGGMGTPGYSMEYAPELKKWTVTPSLVAATDPKDPTAEEYLASGGMGSSTSECCYMQQATLENYYSLGFEDVLQRLGVTLQAEKKRYEFNAGASPKIVDVSLNLLPGIQGTSALAVLDLDDTEICWGLRFVDPAGGKREAAPLITRLNSPALGRAHLLEVGKPYSRQIDLEGLQALRKPGLYRMVLIFDNGKLKKKDENVWTGRILGTTVFEVEIK